MWCCLHHLFRVLALSLPPSCTIWHILLPHGVHTSCLLMLPILWIPFIYNPLTIFSLLLNFWSLLSSQVSLPCPVLSHHMAAYRVMIATYVYNSFIVLRTSITPTTAHWFCSYVSNFRGWEGASLQNEPTLLPKLILTVWGGIAKPIRKSCDMNSQGILSKYLCWISGD